MNEISCPLCKKAFKVDEAGIADIVKEVRDWYLLESSETFQKFIITKLLHRENI